MDLEGLTDEQRQRLGRVYHFLLTYGARKDAADRDRPASTARSATQETRPVDRSGSEPEYNATSKDRKITSD